jgi:hypothetical protein
MKGEDAESRRSEDVPEADALEQERSWADSDDDESVNPSVGIDVPEADALEQARSVPLDDEEELR